MKKKNICKENIKLSNEVFDFIEHVDDVGEESITDYLVWQWRKLNKKFNYLSVEKHTKYKEHNFSGADFELELWILTNNNAISFVFQAKKLLKNYNSYNSKLSYKNKSQSQIDKLITYSKSKKKLPFYIFYSQSDKGTLTKCNFEVFKTAVFISDAFSVKILINSKIKNLSKNRILKETNPFHCLFCCPLFDKSIIEYLKNYFPNAYEIFDGNSEIPNYVNLINENNINNPLDIIRDNGLSVYRNIGVLDLRESK